MINMKKNHTTFILITSILTAMITAGVFIYILKIIENKNQHVSVILSTLQEKMAEKDNAIMFNEKIAEIDRINKSITDRFVDQNKIDEFVSYLEEIGVSTDSEVVVKNIEIPSEDVLALKLSITGTPKNVIRAITVLENIPYQVEIISVSLNEEIEKPEEEKKQKTEASIMYADVSFNILSL